jgi:glycosyltransferase involved in cell wall biosynthesis
LHQIKIAYILKFIAFIILYLLNIVEIFDKFIIKLFNYSKNFYKEKIKRNNEFKKGKKFFKLCTKDILINKPPFPKNVKPLISVVIPVYNAELKIKKAIRSIQNQNISNLEIILINDFSTDKTKDIIDNLQAADERIILLENMVNKGIFYSRCIGTLKSKGKYIFPLDNDDLFFSEFVLDTVVKKAKKGKYDIIEFMYSEYYNLYRPPSVLISTEYGNHTHNLVLKQPELGQFPRKKNNIYGVYDSFIWGKCINSEIYKKSINKIGSRLYSKYILRGEDFIITFVLFRLAESFKFISTYGIFRFKNILTATYQSSRELFLLSRIIYLDVILKFTDNNFEDKMYVVYFSNFFLPIMNEEYNNLNNENKIYFKKVFGKLVNNKYIKKRHKRKFVYYFHNHTNI